MNITNYRFLIGEGNKTIRYFKRLTYRRARKYKSCIEKGDIYD